MLSPLSIILLFLFISPYYSKRHCGKSCQVHAENTLMERYMPNKIAFFENEARKMKESNITYEPLNAHKCINGTAANIFPCKNVDLLGFLPYSSMQAKCKQATQTDGVYGNDIWGWTDPKSRREFALSGQHEQTVIVEVTNGILKPIAVLLHNPSIWSDIKVYKNHMYIGTEGGRINKTTIWSDGIQVYDLTQILDIDPNQDEIPIVKPDTIYKESIKQSHNVVINEDTGYMYVVGSRTTCKGGLHIVDIRVPSEPEFAACYSDDGYTHDAQCIIYKGPDQRYQNREICFAYNEDSLAIIDVHDKDNIKLISNTSYEGYNYTHQGWTTEDHRFLLLDDELDETRNESIHKDEHTRTYIWNIENLENPIHFSDYYSSQKAIDHNLYIKGKYAYQTNYEAGLRILDLTNIEKGELKEQAYFDVHPEPETEKLKWFGSWSSYIYFPSGNIAVNSIERGLFLVKHHEKPKNHC